MKTKLLVMLSLFVTSLYANSANPYILFHDGLIDKRAQDKILEIGNEAYKKLGVKIFVDIKENNGINMEKSIEERRALMKKYEQSLTKDLKQPYVVLTIVIDQLYTNILVSKSVQGVDRDDVLDNYVIPLLASKDKNSLFAKTSAAVLNGYAQIADSIAATKNIKLESSIGSEGKTASTIWRVFMYSLVLGGILLYALIILRERKFRK